MNTYEIKVTQTYTFYRTFQANNEDALDRIVFEVDFDNADADDIETDYTILDVIGE